MPPTINPGYELAQLDRVLELEPHRSIVAVRNVPATLDVFDHHFPRFPVLPGVIILDCLYLAADLLLRETTGRAWRPAGADRIRYRHFVQPGDQVELRFELAEPPGRFAGGKATASVDGKAVTTIRRLELAPVTAGAEDGANP